MQAVIFPALAEEYQPIKGVINKIDNDGDGRISRSEYKLYCRKEKFEDLDINNDGYIDMPEFEKNIFTIYSSPQPTNELLAQRYLEEGRRLFLENKIDEAMQEYKRALVAYPEWGDTHAYIGYIHLKQGNVDNAIESFKDAIRIGPARPHAYVGLGCTYLQKNMPDEAINQLDKAIEMQPNNIAAYSMKADAYLQKGLAQKAVQELNKAAVIDPSSREIQLRLRKVYENQLRGEAQRVKINVFAMHLTNYYPFFVALQKGFFEDYGIEINLVSPQVEKEGIFDAQGRLIEWKRGSVYSWIAESNAMAADVYIGLFTGDFFKIEAVQPGALKGFMLCADTDSHYVTHILVKNGSAIKSVAGLKGKTIACDQHDFGYLLTKYYLEGKGIKDFYIVRIQGNEKRDALIGGKIDALCAGEPKTSILLNDGVVDILVGNPFNDINGSIKDPPLKIFAFSSNFIKKHPKAAIKFKDAIRKALLYSQNHPEEMLLILADYVIGIDKENIKLLKFGAIQELNGRNRKNLQRLADLYYKERYIGNPVEVSNLCF